MIRRELFLRLEKVEARQTFNIDHAQRVSEIEAWFRKKQDEYNSEENRKKREVWYQDLIQKGIERREEIKKHEVNSIQN